MQMSQLAERSGVPVATVKFYLREGLLHPGEATSRTRATYGEDHLDRLLLIKALREVDAPIATIRRVLDVIADPEAGRMGVLQAAQRSLQDGEAPLRMGDCEDVGDLSRAGHFLRSLGWIVDLHDPLVSQLDRAWAACDQAQIGLTEERLADYAEHVGEIAILDVSSVPEQTEAAVRQVVLGTVLMDPVLSTLRRLAHQHAANALAGHPPLGAPAGEG